MVEDGDVFGDEVNVAARLEGLAEPGSIYLSRAAYDQVRDKVHFEFVDSVSRSLKNISRPVHVFGSRTCARHCEARPAHSGDFEESAPSRIAVRQPQQDPAEDYFVDGLTEDIITALVLLALVSGGRAQLDLRLQEQAEERHRDLQGIWERPISSKAVPGAPANQICITIQLIEAATGHHLYARALRPQMTDVFHGSGRDRRTHLRVDRT